MKHMTAKVKKLKDEGKPMPKDYRELEKDVGECKMCCASPVGCADA